MDSIHTINKDEIFHPMTDVSKPEFFKIFMIVKDTIFEKIFVRKEWTYSIAPADMDFIILETLKRGTSWQFYSMQYRITLNTLRKLLWSTLKTEIDILNDHAVVEVEIKTRKKFLKSRNRHFIYDLLDLINHRCMFLTRNKTIWFL